MSGVNKVALAAIVAATKTGPDGFAYVSLSDGQPMLANVPPLIIVNTALVNPVNSNEVAARSTDAADTFLAAPEVKQEGSKYAIITGAVLPKPKKRGSVAGGGAPTKYPFAELAVGGSFFSANSEHPKGNAVKALGSTVSSQNRKFGEPDGDKTKVLKQAKRGEDKKPILDANGKKVIESKTVPVLKYSRKFTIRPVVKGEQYGEWVAPENGALIQRTV